MGVITRKSTRGSRIRNTGSAQVGVWKVVPGGTGYSTGYSISANGATISSSSSSFVSRTVESDMREPGNILTSATDIPQGQITVQVSTESKQDDLVENLAWLGLAEKSFDFWDNEEDSVYDEL